MKPHKWAKEIKAWADGADIECKVFPSGDWCVIESPNWIGDTEYRIKPQPKEPQYLYVYDFNGDINLLLNKTANAGYIGKIKLETEND